MPYVYVAGKVDTGAAAAMVDVVGATAAIVDVVGAAMDDTVGAAAVTYVTGAADNCMEATGAAVAAGMVIICTDMARVVPLH